MDRPENPFKRQPQENFALKAAKIWHEKNNPKGVPDDLQDRLSHAQIFCEMDLTDEEIDSIIWGIEEKMKSLLRDFKINPMEEVTFRKRLDEFRKREISLQDLNQFTNTYLETQASDSPPESTALAQEIVQIKHEIYNKLLKRLISGERSLTARTRKDHIFDKSKKTELEGGIRNGFETIKKRLSEISRYKGIRINCFDLNPDNTNDIEFSDGEVPEENPEFGELEWKEYVVLPEKDDEEEISLQYAIVPSDDGTHTTIIFKLNLEDQELGYIQYHFEGNGIHYIVQRICAHITGVADTFVDTKLQQKLEKELANKRREILRKNNLTKWRDMCTNCCQMLSKILGRPVRFECKRFDVETEEMWEADVSDEQITTNPQNPAPANAQIFPLTLELKNGKLEDTSYQLLMNRIEGYMVDIQKQIVNEKFGGLPGSLKEQMFQMMEDGEITEKEMETMQKLIKRSELSASEQDSLLQTMKEFKNQDEMMKKRGKKR